ncbi:MAG: GIY-YIG nuclease family protein [Terracidiphilus sp.]
MGQVYLFLDTSNGEYKIGATKDDEVEVRLNQLRTGNPYLERYREFGTDYPFDLAQKLMGAFAQKRTRRDFFALDDADLHAIDQIVRDAEAILPMENSIYSLKSKQDNGVLLDPNEVYRELVAELREVKCERERLENRQDELEAQLKTIIGVCRGIRNLVTWKTNEKPTPWFDSKQFKLDEPRLYGAYLRFQFRRMFLLLE